MNKKLINNEYIVKLLKNIVCAYQIKNSDKYKYQIIAYERAADAIEHLSSEVIDIWKNDKLENIPGVGKSISQNLSELLQKGKSKHFQLILKNIPDSVFDIIPIDGIGPKSAYKLVNILKIKSPYSIDKLYKSAKNGLIRNIEGFGEESEREIIKAITSYKKREKRLLINYAENIAKNIKNWMSSEKTCENIEVLGSLRRKCSTIGDIDIAVSSKNTSKVIDRFCSYPNLSRVLNKGREKASIELPMKIRVDLIVVSPMIYGSLLQHFTGSKQHNITLRKYARGLNPSMSISEHGIKKLKSPYSAKATKGKKKLKVNKFKTEEEFYEFLGLSWIPPELREDRGEIEASKSRELPILLELKDIKSDLQIHSDFNVETSHDLGLSTYQKILEKADLLKYEYLAFTEHNPSSKHTDNQIYDILSRKKEWIESINYSLTKKKIGVKYVFNSLEIDIKPDGNLPIDEKSLEILDFALVSIHSSFKLDKKSNTKRIIRALSHPKVKIFAHPSGRKLNERDGVDLDWDEIFNFCKKNNKWIEINCDPMRLDLPDYLVKDAVKYNVSLTLGTDSHSVNQMDNMIYGVNTARRGWCTTHNVINCLNLFEFRKMI